MICVPDAPGSLRYIFSLVCQRSRSEDRAFCPARSSLQISSARVSRVSLLRRPSGHFAIRKSPNQHKKTPVVSEGLDIVGRSRVRCALELHGNDTSFSNPCNSRRLGGGRKLLPPTQNTRGRGIVCYPSQRPHRHQQVGFEARTLLKPRVQPSGHRETLGQMSTGAWTQAKGRWVMPSHLGLLA